MTPTTASPCAARILLALAALPLLFSSPARSQQAASEEMPVLGTFDFENGSLKDWTFTEAEAWRIAPEGHEGSALELSRQSKYQPPVRSPLNIALLPDLKKVGDLDMTLWMQSTAREYGHRDLCLFLGYQDPSHFYYVHLATKADPHAHSIFLVNGEPRVSIAEKRTDGVAWTEGWHKVRLVRKIADGLIEVYFDDMNKPVMTTHDKTFGAGGVGVGTFDDTGRYDDIVIRGRQSD